MSKSFLLLIILTFFHIMSNGEKNCKDIWSMDNSINGLTLYKVTINMCTEGIFVPDNLEERTTPAISFIDYNITNTSQILNATNSSVFQNVSDVIKNILFNETYLTNITNITEEIHIEEYIPSPEPSSTPSPSSSPSLSPLPSPSPVSSPSSSEYTDKDNPKINKIKNMSINAQNNANNIGNNNQTNESNTSKSPNTTNDEKMDTIHVVLLSVGLTILGFVLILIIFIIVKKHHNCNNKICSEDSDEKDEKKSSLYKKPTELHIKDDKHNVKLHINNQVDKLKALEQFKSKRKKGPPLKRKTIAKKQHLTKEFPTRNVQPPPPKYPPGMNAEQSKKEKIRKTISQPKLHSTEKKPEIKKSPSHPNIPTTPPHQDDNV